MGAAARRRGNRRMTTRPAIARLKVTLEDVAPAVMRRLDVPLKIRLDPRSPMGAAAAQDEDHVVTILTDLGQFDLKKCGCSGG
jgi:hypothetical protein